MAFFLATSNDATEQMTILLRSWNRISFARADRKSDPNITIFGDWELKIQKQFQLNCQLNY